jgi:malonyl-CoA/methylmalonyl-CoA synthetase
VSLLALYAPSLRGRAASPALECDEPGGRVLSLTFGEIDARSDRLAALLRARGLSRGDRLAHLLANRAAVIDLWLACIKLGVIVVPINVLYKSREISHIVGDAKPMAIVTTAERLSDLPAGAIAWDVDALEHEAAAVQRLGAAEAAAVTADAATPAALVYTSGTTGNAKGAILTHGSFAANAQNVANAWGITASDRFLCALPLFHVHGLGNGIQSWLATGCHMRLVERFEHEKAAGWFETYKPTLFFGVPTMYVRLLEVAPERARAIGKTMRLFVSGSAPLPAETLHAFESRYGHRILERYGMTETLMIAGNPLHGERRAGTVGLPFPTVAIELRDDTGVRVKDGEAGEVWVRSAALFAGYWQWPEATSAAFRDGWFRTGDIGVRASDGYLALQGRRSDLIISGGFNVYPREIEEVLLTQPGVREAAVVGEGDAMRGEIPVAYVVADSPFDATALEAALRTQLASFKVPRAIHRVESLPRTALGKVQKHLLAAARK